MRFKNGLYFGLCAIAIGMSFTVSAQAGSSLSLRQNGAHPGAVLKAPANHPARRQHSNILRGPRENSEATAHCWTVASCNQMISDCESVGGWFRIGITDFNTGATSEGSCKV